MKNLFVIIIIALLAYFAYSAFQKSTTLEQTTTEETLREEGLDDIADDLPTDSQAAVVEMNSSVKNFFSSIQSQIDTTSKNINDYLDRTF
ncbi:MAG: hypothetical protein PHC89_02100 [Candidatus Pacebacteria bacterium]|nr:hypothetical protein [Candidatus Paceibacterota bacterium]